MKIVHIVEPFASGIAFFVKSLTEAMPDDLHIVVHGERVNEMSAANVKKNFPKKNVRFIKWHSAQRSIDLLKDLQALTQLYHIVRRLKQKQLIDAVHLHSSKSGLLGRAACRMAGVSNVIYTPNGASFLAAKSKWAKFIYQRFEKLGNWLGGQVVCCSASELNEFLKIGIHGSYINNGTEVDHSLNKVIRKPEKKFRIVTSGRIEKQKNPALFNEIAMYFEDMRQVEFVWIGDGPYKKMFKANNIRVTGWLKAGEVHEIVSDSDIYLSTSSYEGLSFAVLEALALKKPVLLSKCTGNIDLVKKGINGDLFNTTQEAILKLLQYYNNPRMLEVMGEYSGEICKKEFDLKKNFKKYRELYTGCLSTGSIQPTWSFG
ncbi:MAG: glycosyltransferase [Chitinophagaceae bacterium]